MGVGVAVGVAVGADVGVGASVGGSVGVSVGAGVTRTVGRTLTTVGDGVTVIAESHAVTRTSAITRPPNLENRLTLTSRIKAGPSHAPLGPMPRYQLTQGSPWTLRVRKMNSRRRY